MKAFVVLILGLVAISAFGKEEFDRVATKQLFERM